MLTGIRPFRGRTAPQLLEQHLHGKPNVAPLPEGDQPVILRSLAKNPKDRFPTCGEMIQALGYHIRRVFIGVFMAGTALAGVGGMMWAQYQAVVNSQIGDSMTILVFIILIIGGLGSVGGCFIGAILVGLTANYVGFLAPKLALGSNILLMALILLWRPRGLFPLAEHH